MHALRRAVHAAAPASRVLSSSATARGPSARSAALCASAEAATLAWLDATVLKLNLCPFAHAPRAAQAVRCIATPAGSVPALLVALRAELAALAALPATPPAHTTLLVAPRCAPLRQLGPFLSALAALEAELEAMELRDAIQLVGFHPQMVFADAPDDEAGLDDAAAYTNRSPFPTFHLLRECDVDAALAACPDAGDAVPARNAATLRGIGAEELEARLEALRGGALRGALFGDAAAAEQPSKA
jgi:hypothetical protein